MSATCSCETTSNVYPICHEVHGTGDVIFNYAEEYFSNGLKPPIVHA